jgi:hypothetical protein
MTSDVTNTTRVEASARVRLPWRHGRKLRRQSGRVRRETRLTMIKLDALQQVGELILAKLAGLSKEEADRGQAHPSGAERFQYTIDKIAQAMGVEVDELIERWKAS